MTLTRPVQPTGTFPTGVFFAQKILEQVVADGIGGDEMRIYLLYRSVDADLEEIEVNEQTVET